VVDWANARTAKNTGKNNASPFMVVENKSSMVVPRPGTHRLGK
jgi:hypothetical protein